jgi:hypothetical protein
MRFGAFCVSIRVLSRQQHARGHEFQLLVSSPLQNDTKLAFFTPERRVYA